MDQESMIVRPRYNGTPGHPLMISSLLVPKICAYEGEGGLGRAIDSLSMPVQEFEVDDEGMTLDADTPADYQLIKEFSTLFPEN
jgi:CTP:molybdopterin cytidylyltransferase MocA